MRVKSEVGSPHNACISTSIYYHVSYDRHLPRAHAYDLNSKAARGVYIERKVGRGNLERGVTWNEPLSWASCTKTAGSREALEGPIWR